MGDYGLPKNPEYEIKKLSIQQVNEAVAEALNAVKAGVKVDFAFYPIESYCKKVGINREALLLS